ncbi:TlpA disulfide reductase family protein [uncultured Algibacter sp.]|uniref:TlpA disulfide reductase family protein n=1 Tax=uncultured Algibacter sp. TaxID=298659 RepID=UPI003216DA97
MKKVLSAVLLLMIFSCNKTENNSYTITGQNYDDFNGKIATLKVFDTIPEGSRAIQKSGKITNGTFTIKGTIDFPEYAILFIENDNKNEYPYNSRLVLESGNIDLLYNPKKHINTVVKGAKYNQIFYDSIYNNKRYTDIEKTMQENLAVYRKDTTNIDAYEKYDAASLKIWPIETALHKNLVEHHPDPTVKLLALKNANYFDTNDYKNTMTSFDLFTENLKKEIGRENIKEIINQKALLKQAVDYYTVQEKNAYGKKIDNFTAKDINGNMVTLSDLLKKNKYVLVEFWASWCSPCRAEIPHMKKAYKTYKDKGFEIFSFSLDHKKDSWIKASKDEDIPWLNTSDSRAFQSPIAKQFGLASLPANFLIDSNGIIVGKDLRDVILDAYLKDVFTEK